MHSVKGPSEPCEFEFIQRIGFGAFGEVYSARQHGSDQLSAIKLIKLQTEDDFHVFRDQVHALTQCLHPNIVAHHGCFVSKEKLHIVMEYCSGGSLRDIYTWSGPLSEMQIAFVCREMLRGLLYLHQTGKVHKDIKGANVLITENGDVKLADFGVGAQITAAICKRKVFIGSPYWMAPEIASVDKTNFCDSPGRDIWAVGITAIELAELQPPLSELHPMQVLYRISKSNYKAPHLKEKQKWSQLMHDFVKVCLTKDPKKRPSAEDLLVYSPFLMADMGSELTKDLLELRRSEYCNNNNEEC